MMKIKNIFLLCLFCFSCHPQGHLDSASTSPAKESKKNSSLSENELFNSQILAQIKNENPNFQWLQPADLNKEVIEIISKNKSSSITKISSDLNSDGVNDYGILGETKDSILFYSALSKNGKWDVQLLRSIRKYQSNEIPYDGYLQILKKSEYQTKPNKSDSDSALLILEHYAGASMPYVFDPKTQKMIEFEIK